MKKTSRLGRKARGPKPRAPHGPRGVLPDKTVQRPPPAPAPQAPTPHPRL